jgi:hypothetical protein
MTGRRYFLKSIGSLASLTFLSRRVFGQSRGQQQDHEQGSDGGTGTTRRQQDDSIRDFLSSFEQIQGDQDIGLSTPIYEEETLIHAPIIQVVAGAERTVWLHVSVKRWFPNIWEQAQSCKAWTTDAKVGGNRANVDKLFLQMYGYWDNGNNTDNYECRNCNYLASVIRRENNFPFPVTKSKVSATARCWGPNRGPIRASVG